MCVCVCVCTHTLVRVHASVCLYASMCTRVCVRSSVRVCERERGREEGERQRIFGPFTLTTDKFNYCCSTSRANSLEQYCYSFHELLQQLLLLTDLLLVLLFTYHHCYELNHNITTTTTDDKDHGDDHVDCDNASDNRFDMLTIMLMVITIRRVSLWGFIELSGTWAWI